MASSGSGGAHRSARKRVRIADLPSSSDDSDASDELDNQEQPMAVSSFISMSRDPLDVTKVPQAVALPLIKRALFLLGSDYARYPTEFLISTSGLCARGFKFKELVSDELFPLGDLVGTYHVSKKGNRHPLKFIKDPQTARDALHMYQRVYGGTQPDNGEFGTSFIRGLALYYQKNLDVNWAERANELAVACMKSPGKNPMKLTPPCLREQIQAMINVFSHYLVDAHQRLAAASKPKPGIPQRNSVSPARNTLSLPAVASAQRWRDVSSGSPALAGRHDLEREAQKPHAPKAKPVEILRAKQKEAAERLKSLLQHTETLKNEQAKRGQLLSGLIASEEVLWDEHHELRQHAKAMESNDSEKARLNDAVRAKGRKVTAASAAVESEKELLRKTESALDDNSAMADKLKVEIQKLEADIGIVLVESSWIQPQAYLLELPAEATDLSSINMFDPCASCHRYFCHLAVVPFSCGCLFHPHCMFKTALMEVSVCPRCCKHPSRPWMLQWGFASNQETLQASIVANKSLSRALGWESQPADAENAVAGKIEEGKQVLAEPLVLQFHMAKQSASDSSTLSANDRAKRPCGSSLPAPKIKEADVQTLVSLGRTVIEVQAHASGSPPPLVVNASNILEPPVAHVLPRLSDDS